MIKFPGSPPRTAHSVSLTDGRRGSSCRQLCQPCQAGPVGGGAGGFPGSTKDPALHPPALPPSPGDGRSLEPSLAGAGRLQRLEAARGTPPLSSASGLACQGPMPAGASGGFSGKSSGLTDQPKMRHTQTSSAPSPTHLAAR